MVNQHPQYRVDWPWLIAILVAAVVVVTIIASTGCAAADRIDMAAVRATIDEITALKAEIDEIRLQAIGDVQGMGDVKIKSDVKIEGDPITSWILAVGIVLAGIYYPVHRKIRHLLGKPSDPLKVRIKHGGAAETLLAEADALHKLQERFFPASSLRRSRKGQAGKGK